MTFLQRAFIIFTCGCVMADELTDITLKVKIGDNVTLNCSLHTSSIYWFIQRYEKPPVPILCIYNRRDDSAYYFNNSNSNKYSVEVGNALVIKNITMEDYGVYYCLKKTENDVHAPPFNISNSHRLSTAVRKQSCPPPFNRWPDGPMILSITLNAVLAFMLVLASAALCGRKRRQRTDPPPDPNDPPQTMDVEYDLVEVISQPGNLQRVANASTIYSTLQTPQTAGTLPMFTNLIYTHG